MIRLWSLGQLTASLASQARSCRFRGTRSDLAEVWIHY